MAQYKNITIDDETFILEDDADPTKKATFELSGLTTATTRVFTLPDADVTLLGSDGSGDSSISGTFTAGALLATDALASTPAASVGLEYITGTDTARLIASDTAANQQPNFQLILQASDGTPTSTPIHVQGNNGGLVNVGIGNTSPQGDAALDVGAGAGPQYRGFMPPKVTSAQMASFSGFSNMDGLQIYNTDIQKLFYLDNVTSGGNYDWYSMESATLTFGFSGTTTGETQLSYGGSLLTGWVAPYAGIIKEVTALEQGGNPTKGFIIYKNGISADTFVLSGSKYIEGAQGVIFSAGDVITVSADGTGADVNDPVVTLQAKWRFVIPV